MPQAVIAAIGAAVAKAAVTAAVTIGITTIARAIFGGSGPKPSDGTQTVRAAVGTRKRHYGIVHTGGQLSFFESKNGTLAQVLTLGTGKEGEILQHRINDKPVTVAAGTITETSFRGALHIYTRLGSDTQTAIGELTTKFPEWTSDHRQRGCAHAAIIADPVKPDKFSEVYNNQVPQYTQVRKAAHVYDPRKDDTAVIGLDGAGAPIMGSGSHRLDDSDTWEWSDNGPLVIADYFAHPDGYGGGYDSVNWANMAQEADIADEEVLTVSAEAIARWRIWASYGLASDERRDVLTNMLKAVDGFCWQDADGLLNLMVGRFVEPDVTLTDDHILAIEATLGPKADQRVDAIKVIYTEAAIGYREQESATVFDPDADEDPSAAPQGVPNYYVPHHNQAVRTGKLIFAQLGDRWRMTLLVNLYGLNLLGRRFVRVSTAQLGVTAYFKVDGLRLFLNQDPPAVEAMLSEVKPEDWDFDAATEEGTPPLAPGAAGGPSEVPVPTGLTLTAVQIALGGASAVAIEASWDDPDRPDLTYQVQYRPSAGGTWVVMAVDSDMFTARSGAVDTGTEFEVRLRAATITGRTSAWTATASITPVAAMGIAAPTSLGASGGTGSATISFRMPTSSSLAFARVYGSASSTFGAAVQVGSDIVAGLGAVVSVTQTGLAAGTRFYWARAFDGSGGQSSLTGPISATIS